MDEREKLQERYDDAAFALMMDECAEADGEAFLAEFRAAAEAGDLPEIPADLDRRFRDTIKREFAARERKVRFRQFKRAAARVAVAVFAVIGVLSTLVMTVDAIRIPVMNFFVEFFDGFAEIGTDYEKENHEVDPYLLLEGLLPGDYEKVVSDTNTMMSFGLYENDNGDTVSLDIISAGAEINYDTEDAVCSTITLNDYEAMIVEKKGYSVIWADEAGVTYIFYASNISKKDAVEICSTLAVTMKHFN